MLLQVDDADVDPDYYCYCYRDYLVEIEIDCHSSECCCVLLWPSSSLCVRVCVCEARLTIKQKVWNVCCCCCCCWWRMSVTASTRRVMNYISCCYCWLLAACYSCCCCCWMRKCRDKDVQYRRMRTSTSYEVWSKSVSESVAKSLFTHVLLCCCCCRCLFFSFFVRWKVYELWKVVGSLMMSLRLALVLQILFLKYSANLSPWPTTKTKTITRMRRTKTIACSVVCWEWWTWYEVGWMEGWSSCRGEGWCEESEGGQRWTAEKGKTKKKKRCVEILACVLPHLAREGSTVVVSPLAEDDRRGSAVVEPAVCLCVSATDDGDGVTTGRYLEVPGMPVL